jgi:hypothetical protein
MYMCFVYMLSTLLGGCWQLARIPTNKNGMQHNIQKIKKRKNKAINAVQNAEAREKTIRLE